MYCHIDSRLWMRVYFCLWKEYTIQKLTLEVVEGKIFQGNLISCLHFFDNYKKKFYKGTKSNSNEKRITKGQKREGKKSLAPHKLAWNKRRPWGPGPFWVQLINVLIYGEKPRIFCRIDYSFSHNFCVHLSEFCNA